MPCCEHGHRSRGYHNRPPKGVVKSAPRYPPTPARKRVLRASACQGFALDTRSHPKQLVKKWVPPGQTVRQAGYRGLGCIFIDAQRGRALRRQPMRLARSVFCRYRRTRHVANGADRVGRAISLRKIWSLDGQRAAHAQTIGKAKALCRP